MRRSHPVIIGAGPAGCAAAITLARGGVRPLILEKSAEVGDALCGGFLSWQTLQTLDALGIRPRGHQVTRLRVFSAGQRLDAPLPAPAQGLSRRAMDSALAETAVAAGAGLERDVMVRQLDDLVERHEAIFLATGKHDLRGAERPRDTGDPAMGLRIRLPAAPGQTRRIGDTIELHMFDRGYAGVELQEDGSANICLALRKSLLTDHGRDPRRLLLDLGRMHPAFGDRLDGFSDGIGIDAVAAVPYGWRAREGVPGLFRIGDQCGVIPSLAGEGNGIALASGQSAAAAYLSGGAAASTAWQARFAGKSRRPIGLATAIWRASEGAVGRGLIPLALRLIPSLAPAIARATRIEP